MTKELRLPSAYVEVKENEMEYLDGGLWWVIAGKICEGIGAACSIAGHIVVLCDGDSEVANGLKYGGLGLTAVGAIVSGDVKNGVNSFLGFFK